LISIRFDEPAELPERTVRLVHLRPGGIEFLPPCVTAAERAALALVDAASALANGTEGVPEEIWHEAARHYDEAGIAALVVEIARGLDHRADRAAGLAA
jgi:hypothetical protein